MSNTIAAVVPLVPEGCTCFDEQESPHAVVNSEAAGLNKPNVSVKEDTREKLCSMIAFRIRSVLRVFLIAFHPCQLPAVILVSLESIVQENTGPPQIQKEPESRVAFHFGYMPRGTRHISRGMPS